MVVGFVQGGKRRWALSSTCGTVYYTAGRDTEPVDLTAQFERESPRGGTNRMCWRLGWLGVVLVLRMWAFNC